MKKQQIETTTTQYSGDIRGDAENYYRAVSLDFTDGYIGISQQAEKLERVLLTPKQFDKLVEYVKHWRQPNE